MHDILHKLSEQQKKAATHVHGPLLILAGAGSGKTRVVTTRAAHLLDQGIPGRQILCLTFTNKAAGEMMERLNRMRPGSGIWISTFHAMCARLLRVYIDRLGYAANFSIYDEQDKLSCIKALMKDMLIDPSQFPPGKLSHLISHAKSRLEDARAHARTASGFHDTTVSRIYSAYENRMQESNALDFDDLLLHMHRLMTQHDEVRRELQDRFRYIMVDEYQDTNQVQYHIVHHLARQHRNICATGDPDQAIYAWRGADIRNILEFEHDFPDAITIKLEQNYRSTQTILDAAQGVIRHNVQRKEKSLWTAGARGPRIRVMACTDAAHEARQVVAWIRALALEDVLPRDIAVFYRINAQSRQLETTLMEHGIPYRIAGGVAFYQRKEVKDVLAYLRILQNPRDTASFARIINTPTRGLGKNTAAALQKWAHAKQCSILDVMLGDQVRQLKNRQQASIKKFVAMYQTLRANLREPIWVVIQSVIENSGYEDMLLTSPLPQDRERLENIRELITAARQYQTDNPEEGLEGFLENVSLISDLDGLQDAGSAITLMTLHSAKGLEFSAVAITGFEQGLLPHERSMDTPDALEEERRLCYVGITRAKMHLLLTHVRYREQYGASRRRTPSSFLMEIPKHLLETEDLTCPTYADTMHGHTGYAHVAPDVSYEEDWPEEELSQDPEDQFHVGDQVRHPSFGTGQIIQATGLGIKRKIIVDFPGLGRKKLLLRYAGLRKT